MVDPDFSGLALGLVIGWSALFNVAHRRFAVRLRTIAIWLGGLAGIAALQMMFGLSITMLAGGVATGSLAHFGLRLAIMARGAKPATARGARR